MIDCQKMLLDLFSSLLVSFFDMDSEWSGHTGLERAKDEALDNDFLSG